SADWLEVHGHPIVAVESFVDSQLMFRGTAYKAAGWTPLGPTAGFGRCAEDFYQRHDRPKQLWVRALDAEGLAVLKAPKLPSRLAAYEVPAQPRALSGQPLMSLLDRLPEVPEPRDTKGRRHPWPAVLGIVCLAKLAGVAGAQRDIARFARRLDQRQRRHLGCWRNPQTGRREVPSQSTFFRALKAVDYEALEPLLVGWQDDLLGPADPKELIVLDGKAARGAGGQTVISAVAVPSGHVLGVEVVRTQEQLQPDDRPHGGSRPAETPATPPMPAEPTAWASATLGVSVAPAGPSIPAATAQTPQPFQLESPPASSTAAKKENEIPAARRLLARIPITGRLVSLDAMHTQHQTAGQIVLEAGADYLLTLKDNQPTLLATAQTLVPGAFFPSGSGATQTTHGPDGGEKP
ncbi:MAG TPA: transposase family protein, partial [Candidatus Methylomirabilis sp.]|nr:transposase family protein [Candidatus Methylomirabilis sp.]